MTIPFLPVLAEFSSSQQVAMIIVAMGVGFVLLVSLVGIIVPAWAGVATTRMQVALKQQMLERGLSVDEIVRLLEKPAPAASVVDYPCASEVVIERDDQWHPGFILRRDGDRYFVHYVGEPMSENEWVPGARIRFPEASKTTYGSPWDWADHSHAFADGSWCTRSAKPAPVEQDI